MIDYRMFIDELQERYGVNEEDENNYQHPDDYPVHINYDMMLNHISGRLKDICVESLKSGNTVVVEWVGKSQPELAELTQELDALFDINGLSERLSYEILEDLALNLISKEVVDSDHYPLLKQSFDVLGDPIHFAQLVSLFNTTLDYTAKHKNLDPRFLSKANFSERELAAIYSLGSAFTKGTGFITDVEAVPTHILANPMLTGIRKSSFSDFGSQMDGFEERHANRIRDEIYQGRIEYYALEIIAAKRLGFYDLKNEEYVSFECYEEPSGVNQSLHKVFTQNLDAILNCDIEATFDDIKRNSKTFKKAQELIRESYSIYNIRMDTYYDSVSDIDVSPLDEVRNCLELALINAAAFERINELALKSDNNEYFLGDFIAIFSDAGIRGRMIRHFLARPDIPEMTGLSKIFGRVLDNYDENNKASVETLKRLCNRSSIAVINKAVHLTSNAEGVRAVIKAIRRRFEDEYEEEILHFSERFERDIPAIFARAEELNPKLLTAGVLESVFENMPVSRERFTTEVYRILNQEKLTSLEVTDVLDQAADVSFLQPGVM